MRRCVTAIAFLVRCTLLTVVFCLTSILALGQTAQKGFTVDPYIPKTPAVSAVEKFIDNPVSMHTGAHDFSIPVFQVPLRNLTIPIALKYNSSGIKVEDVATDVGSGWSLSSVGAVSSKVHGIPDTEGLTSENVQKVQGSIVATYPNPYISLENLSGEIHKNIYESVDDKLDIYTGGDIDFLKGVLRSIRDTEPDLYFFSSPTVSGRFYQDANGFMPIPYQRTKIEQIVGGYRITDESGNVFEFKAKETTFTSSYNLCTGIGTNPYRTEFPHYSYQLTSITLPTGEFATFSYSEYIYSMINQKQWNREGPGVNADQACRDTYIPFVTGEGCPTQSTTTFHAQRLTGMTTSNGYNVSFLYDSQDRKDIPGTKALQEIKVTDQSGNVLKDFTLDHSYFYAGFNPLDSNSYKLKLVSAGEVGKPPYTFAYDEEYPIANRLSLSQDHFGYYNGASNGVLLPAEPQYGFESGANREPDYNYAKTGILKKVTYPTKGTLTFEYEPHKYYSNGINELIYPQGSQVLLGVANQTVAATFTIPNPSVRQKVIWTNSDDGKTTHNDYCKIRINGPDNYEQLFQGNGPPGGLLTIIPPGTYTITIETIGTTFSGDITVLWLGQTNAPAGDKLTGGFRIKRIENCPTPGTGCVSKSFYYEKDSGESSGVLYYRPTYTYNLDKSYTEQPGDNDCGEHGFDHTCNVYFQSSSSILPLGSAQGSNIAYSQVTIVEADSVELGKTVHKFLLDKSGSPVSVQSYPFTPVILSDWLNGLPLETTQYAFKDNAFVKVKRSRNTYNYNGLDGIPADSPHLNKIKGAKIALLRYAEGYYDPCYPGYVLPPLTFTVVKYELTSSWHHLTKTEESTFTSNTDSLTVTTIFERDTSHLQVTTVTKNESNGDTTKMYQKYPLDFSTTGILATMRTKNMITPIIEQRVERIKPNGDRKVVGANLTLYKDNFGRPSPEKFLQLNVSSPMPTNQFFSYNGTVYDSSYVLQSSIEQYDSHSNPSQYSDRSGVKHAFIWDHDGTLVVAHAINALQSDIAYTSFETVADGGWTMGTYTPVTTDSVTGKQCHDLSTRSISRTLSNTKQYIFSYWSKGGSQTVTSTSAVEQGGVAGVNGWTYHQYLIAGSTSVELSGSGKVDELRIYPKDATMTTYTHAPGVGVTTVTDANSIISYYRYDSLNRLVFIMDQNRNVVKRYSYNYKQ